MSFVRSVTLDVLSVQDIEYIRKGGNAAFNKFVPQDWKSKRWREKKILYESDAFETYREELRGIVQRSTENNPDGLSDAFHRARGISLSHANSREREVTNFGFKSKQKIAKKMKEKRKNASWVDDKDATKCMHCGANFTMFRRRHHCRKCGACLCSACAPSDNVRPCPENGYTTSVRVCLRCFNPGRR